MALQFNEYFVQNNLIPTLKQLMVRMSDTEDTTGKGEYLKDLLKERPLKSEYRKKYHEDFFTGSQPTNRPFMDESESKYRDELINELEIYIRQRKNLSGKKGMMAALFPTGDNTYKSSSQLQRNMNLLAYRLAKKFEKNRIKELKGGEEISKEDKEKLENGKFILVTINGKEQVVEESDLQQVAADAEIVAFVQPGLLQRIQEGTAAERPTSQKEVPEVRTIKKEIEGLFKESELESMRDVLEKSGLEVVDLHKEGDEIVGIVEAEGHQRLDVRIDPKAGNSNPWKFTFTFKEAVPDSGEVRGFHFNQNDLQIKFMAGGARQTAEDVYQVMPESAKFKKHEMPVSRPMVEPRLPMQGPIAGPAAGEEGKIPVTIKAKGEVVVPAAPIPTVAPAPPTPAAPAKKAVQKRPSPPKVKKRAVAVSVPKAKPAAVPPKKETVQAKKRKTEARKQAAQQAGIAQQLAAQQAAQQQAAQQRAAMGAKKKKHRRRMAALVGGSVAIPTLGASGGLAAYLMARAGLDTETVSFILNCIGSICIG